MSTYRELMQQIDVLKKQAKKISTQERRAAIRQINTLISAYNITVSEVRFFASREPVSVLSPGE